MAGVTIAALSGANGILTEAAKAKEETEKGNIIELAKTDLIGEQVESKSGEVTGDMLKEVLDKYFGDVPNAKDITLDTPITAKEEYGSYKMKVSDIYDGEIKGVVSIPEGLEIGSTVSYNPSGTYLWDYEYCSSPENTSDDKTLNSATGQPFNIDTWKVFDINKESGEVILVPDHSTDDGGIGTSATTGTVYLSGAQGYNNVVYLLNEACSNLYGDSAKGITARSINIEDIEGKMTEEALASAHKESNYNNAPKYGEQVSSAYNRNYSYFPSIYSKEALSVVDGTLNNSGIGMSEQSGLIEPSADEATNGHLQATTSIQPYQTYWYKNDEVETAFKDAGNGVNYYDLLMPDGYDTFYWVASRCVDTNSSSCNFTVRYVYNGGVDACHMFYSGEDDNYGYFGLFPVVSLSSEVIGGDSGSGFVVQ